MRISIITVVFNGRSVIEETMLSVLNQPYSDWEYIIVDGGSTDGTLEVVNKYRDRLACVISEPDRGIYDAMNKGIARAGGEVVGMINAGDHYFEGAFGEVAAAFRDHSLDGHILWGDVQYEKLGRVRGYRPENLKIGAFAPHPSMFCPLAVYQKIGMYDTSFRFLGDYDFMYRAINECHIRPIYIPALLAYYQEGGVSDRHVRACLQEELRVKLKYGQPRWAAVPVYWLKLLKNVTRM